MNITEREQGDVTIYVVEGRVDSEGAVDLDMALQAGAVMAAPMPMGKATRIVMAITISEPKIAVRTLRSMRPKPEMRSQKPGPARS